MKKLLLFACIIFSMISTSANANIIYTFNFTNLYQSFYSNFDNFSISLTYSNYVTTTGMQALSNAPIPTSLGYTVNYAGTDTIGLWGFSYGSQATLDDGGFFFGSYGSDSESFLFQPDIYPTNYYSAPGMYYGSVSGNPLAGTGPAFNGSAVLTITDTSAVPVPTALWLFSSGLIGLIGVARKKQ